MVLNLLILTNYPIKVTSLDNIAFEKELKWRYSTFIICFELFQIDSDQPFKLYDYAFLTYITKEKFHLGFKFKIKKHPLDTFETILI